MKIAVFSTKPYDRKFLEQANAGRHDLHFLEPHLSGELAALATGFDGVCAFVNDHLDAPVIEELARLGVRLIAAAPATTAWCAAATCCSPSGRVRAWSNSASSSAGPPSRISARCRGASGSVA